MDEKDIAIKITGLKKRYRLGVIGGGYASALTDAGFTVDCITKNPEDIAYAKQHGMIRYGTCEVEPTLVAEAQLIIFALYPTVFIDWIEQTNRKMGLPDGFDVIRDEDIPQMIAWARKEANPLYPVPVLMDQSVLASFYEKVADWRETP